MQTSNVKTIRRSNGHRTSHTEARWPDLAPIYGVQYRRTGHAITFTEDERAHAEQLVREAPEERRLVVARWIGTR